MINPEGGYSQENFKDDEAVDFNPEMLKKFQEKLGTTEKQEKQDAQKNDFQQSLHEQEVRQENKDRQQLQKTRFNIYKEDPASKAKIYKQEDFTQPTPGAQRTNPFELKKPTKMTDTSKFKNQQEKKSSWWQFWKKNK
jgi:hypothetical protein